MYVIGSFQGVCDSFGLVPILFELCSKCFNTRCMPLNIHVLISFFKKKETKSEQEKKESRRSKICD